MTAANFDRCLALVLRHEGGFCDNKHDNGGATNLGLTLQTAREAGLDCDADGDVDVADVKKITPQIAGRVYRSRYWSTVHGDELPGGVDYMVFDAAVNHGPTRARKFLQMALGVQSDGVIGKQTLAALKKADPRRLINAFSLYRRNLYTSHPDFRHFGKGWLRRLDEVTAQSLRWV